MEESLRKLIAAVEENKTEGYSEMEILIAKKYIDATKQVVDLVNKFNDNEKRISNIDKEQSVIHDNINKTTGEIQGYINILSEFKK